MRRFIPVRTSVVADDWTTPNHSGTKTDTLIITITALVRHTPTLQTAIVDGSLQMLSAEKHDA